MKQCYFGSIGVPIGVVSGLLAIFVLLKIVNNIGGSYMFSGMDGISFGVNYIPVVVAVVLRLCNNIFISNSFC